MVLRWRKADKRGFEDRGLRRLVEHRPIPSIIVNQIIFRKCDLPGNTFRYLSEDGSEGLMDEKVVNDFVVVNFAKKYGLRHR
jgi:hypothetical protein